MTIKIMERHLKVPFHSVCRKRSPKGGFFVIIDKGEENVSKRNHGKKHL